MFIHSFARKTKYHITLPTLCRLVKKHRRQIYPKSSITLYILQSLLFGINERNENITTATKTLSNKMQDP